MESEIGPDWLSRPGDSVLAQMRRRGVPAGALAEALVGGPGELAAILAGTARIDAAAAAALAPLLGGDAGFWTRRQANFDRALAVAVDRVAGSEGDEWLSRVPGPDGSSAGRVPRSSRTRELAGRLAFYGVGSLAAWEQRYGGLRDATSFRTSRAYASSGGPVAHWLRKGELAAALVDAAAFDRDALLALIPGVRALTRVRQLDRCLPALRDLLATAGVALAVVPAPKGCRASGASRFVEPGRAMLLLSLRHRSDDQLWFTVFHEIGHLVLHGRQAFVDEDDTPVDDREREADEFAARCIVPASRADELAKLAGNYRDITRFAVSVGVAPGLVVGQLQHREIVARDRLNFLKRRFSKEEAEAAGG